MLLYIDKHLINEVTSPQAFDGLRATGRRPWRRQSVLATADHNIPTLNRRAGMHSEIAQRQLATLERNCEEYGLQYYSLTDARQGILHVVAPELGETLPGITIACGDSHTTTHGAFATLAFGIGTSDIEQVLATQCLQVPKLKTMNVRLHGAMRAGVYAKDIALAFLRKFGTDCAAGCALEFSGNVVSGLSMESRMTLCNLAAEAGARVGIIGVDDITIDYLKGRPSSPQGHEWALATEYWSTLHTDDGAKFHRNVEFDVSDVAPQVTWGTTPAMTVSLFESVPDPRSAGNLDAQHAAARALDYMGLKAGTPMRSIALDKIFIGSCTNSRIEDLRIVAGIVKRRKVAAGIRQALIVPGSGLVKRQAEEEGLHEIFLDAGFEWRDAGCSMCLGMNNDSLSEGERCASTSNRNFEGRQGRGGRSHLLSPAIAAATAIAGRFAAPEDI